MSMYYVEGVEQEAGVRAVVPVEAESRAQAKRKARAQGILKPRIKGKNLPVSDPVVRSLEEHEIGPEEVSEMTSESVRPTVLRAWMFALFVLPFSVALTFFISQVTNVPAAAMIIVLMLIVTIVLATYLTSLSRFLR